MVRDGERGVYRILYRHGKTVIATGGSGGGGGPFCPENTSSVRGVGKIERARDIR